MHVVPTHKFEATKGAGWLGTRQCALADDLGVGATDPQANRCHSLKTSVTLTLVKSSYDLAFVRTIAHSDTCASSCKPFYGKGDVLTIKPDGASIGVGIPRGEYRPEPYQHGCGSVNDLIAVAPSYDELWHQWY